MIDDGYTERMGEIRFRRLLRRDRGRVIADVRRNHVECLDDWLFQPPYVFSQRMITDEQKSRLLPRLMENPSEAADFENLIDSVTLMLTRPLLFLRSCEKCQEWWFDEATGLVSRGQGELLQRPSHAPVPCDTDRGCRKRHYSRPLTMSAKNKAVWNHWMEYRVVGCPNPECPIVRRHWNAIHELVEKHGLPEVCQRLHRQGV